MKRLLGALLLSLLISTAYAQLAQPRRAGLIWAGGQLCLLQRGRVQPVTREVRLPSGTRILPDGQVTLANGRQGRFLTGDGVDPQTGTWFARRAKKPDGTVFLPLPIRLELPSSTPDKLSAVGNATGHRYRSEPKRPRDKDDRILPDEDEDDED